MASSSSRKKKHHELEKISVPDDVASRLPSGPNTIIRFIGNLDEDEARSVLTSQ
jgi:hypothetical protein